MSQVIKIHAKERENSKRFQRCPYCHDGFDEARVKTHICQQCKVKLHTACLRVANRCPVCNAEDPVINAEWKTEKIARRNSSRRQILNQGLSPTQAQSPSGFYFGRRRRKLNPGLSPTWQSICAFASLIIPGFGQLLQGRLLAAMGFFLLATFCFCVGLLAFFFSATGIPALLFCVGCLAWPLSACDALRHSP